MKKTDKIVLYAYLTVLATAILIQQDIISSNTGLLALISPIP